VSVINNRTANSMPEPWMTELWEWADNFEISPEHLPRNAKELLAITDLDLRNKNLTKLPESIGQLTQLRRLIVSDNQLEKLPDSISQLSNLKYLDIMGNPLTTLPESIVQLKKLDYVAIAEDETTAKLVGLSQETTDFLRGLPFGCKGLHDSSRSSGSNSIRDYLRKQLASDIATIGEDDDEKLPTNLSEKHRDKRVWTEGLPLTSLYSPTTSEYGLSKCGFLIIEEGWDEKSLVELKDKIGATCLLGLQTTEKTIENCDVIDGVVICQPDEVDKVVALYDAILASEMTHPYNINDIKIPSWHIQPARFIQVKAIGMPDSETLKALADQLIQQIPTGCIIDNILFFCEGHRFLSLIELNELTLIIESICTDNTEAFYEMKTVDDTDDFWMGMVYVAS
jgi:hypothetical protein